jgi:D-glycero-D-manno-heptose 1,7-bisphosphate phosphatase
MEVIILAGGFGTRLKEIVSNVPKPLADINGKPFLYYLVKYLKNQGFTKIHLSLYYGAEKIIEYFKNEEGVEFHVEDSPLGTGGAIYYNLQFTRAENIFVFNGDCIGEASYKKMLREHEKKQSKVTLLAMEVENTDRYGILEMNEVSGVITNFREKTLGIGRGFINAGCYILNRSFILKELSSFKGNFSIESDFFAKTKASQLFAFKANGRFIDIGIPEDYQKGQKLIPEITMAKALFLDRDGVINEDRGHPFKILDIKFIDGIFEFAKNATEKGYLIFVVTNQAGIAKGFYTLDDFQKTTRFIENEFIKHGSKISKTYFCPFHPEGKVADFIRDSFDRKPNPGMILKAAEEFNLDLKNSILLGDKESDVKAGENAGVSKLYLFKNNFDEITL